jgi:hypothetical protein
MGVCVVCGVLISTEIVGQTGSVISILSGVALRAYHIFPARSNALIQIYLPLYVSHPRRILREAILLYNVYVSLASQTASILNPYVDHDNQDSLSTIDQSIVSDNTGPVIVLSVIVIIGAVTSAYDPAKVIYVLVVNGVVK